MKLRSFVLGFAALAASFASAATEYFVDPIKGVDGAGRGTSETTAFLSLQAAVDAAAKDDVITLLPGDHVAGVTNTAAGNSRVVVTKRLTFRSKNGRASRDTTRIVGAWGTTNSAAYPWGMSADCVRCVCVESAASGSRFEGITFYRGSATTGDKDDGYSGGLLVRDSKAATAVDCAFVECQGRNGAAFGSASANAGCVAARCLFKNCRVYKFGIYRGGSCYNCVFDDNGPSRKQTGATQCDGNAWSGAITYAAKVVNCTFFGNAISAADASRCTGIYNCLLMNNCEDSDTLVSYTTGVYSNCVSSQSTLTNANSRYVSYTQSTEVFSPGDDDYRLVKGATAIGAGSTDFLKYIPTEFRDTDYAGNARLTGAAVSCGAVEAALTNVASGLRFTCDPTKGFYVVDGKTNFTCRSLVQREGVRGVVNVKYVSTTDQTFLRYKVGDDTFCWPKRDDSIWLCNVENGTTPTVNVLFCGLTYNVATNGNDTTGDGSAAKPYATIQKAVDAVVAANVDATIFVSEGDYATGSREMCSLKNRVAVPAEYIHRLRVLAVDGPEKTFITGAEDPAGTTEWKLGSGATRCMAVHATNSSQSVVFQGFTLRGGRAATGSSSDASRGGALANFYASGPGTTCELLDCVVTNCAAGTASCSYGGSVRRCRVVGCIAYEGLLRSGSAYAYHSLFVNTIAGNSSARVVGHYTRFCGCTICGSGCTTVNRNAYEVRGCVLSNLTQPWWDVSDSTLNYDKADSKVFQETLYGRVACAVDETNAREWPARFALREPGDYTLLPSSAGCGLVSTNCFYFPPVDVNGEPFAFTLDGRCNAGAFTSMSVSDPRTFYVDAVGGSDANDGSSPDKAFQTLAKAMAGVAYGDKVIVLPGTYASGTMLETLQEAVGEGSARSRLAPTVPARVVVKPGVTLESRDGAATTVIQGATGTRCVFLCKDAVLRGFTVTGGDALEIDSDTSVAEDVRTASVNVSGGGILAHSGAHATDAERLALVENCVISNNTARNGAGANYGHYRNCLFAHNKNKLAKPGNAARFTKLEGCLFRDNGPSHSTVYCSDMFNCTVLGGQPTVLLKEGYYDSALVNSIVLTSINLSVYSNCVFAAGVENAVEGTVYAANCVTGTVEQIALDADGVPQRGSIAIDFGDNARLPSALAAAGDLAGGQRVMNARVDAGAYEYDWRADYSAALARRRLTVTDVPSDAVLADGRLGWTDGTVSLDWAKGSVEAPYEFEIVVDAGASLTVTLNGATLGIYTAGTQVVQFNSAADVNRLVFAATGHVSIARFRALTGMAIFMR